MEPKEPVKPKEPVPPARRDRPVLLLVDDQPANLLALEALLGRDDLEILSATSGREALEVLLARDVSLAIVDVQMPEMDGFELARLMGGVERTRRVPIIFVTAGAERPAWIFEAYRSGAVDFLWKPIDTRILRSKVDVFIALDAQRRAVQESEQRFRSLVEATSQVVWVAVPGGFVVEDSPSWRAFTGQRFEELAGHGWLDAVHPEDHPRVRAAWRRAAESRAPGEAEYRLRRPDGSYTWTAARWAPVIDDRGALVEWIGANTDISERKEAERLREMFIAILGHDLRNPVGSMMTATQLVLGRTTDEKIAKPLQRVLASGDRAVRMIEQLLDMTRIRMGGGIVLSPAATDLRRVAEDALAELAAAKDRACLEAFGDTAGTWDPDRLFQIASNLIGNALQHSPEGAPVVVRVDGREPGHVELTVHNAGPAIPAALRDRLFEPFRGSNEHRGARGLGLGLFITKQLALVHGGTLDFESTDERGTTFTLRLPRHAPAGAHGRVTSSTSSAAAPAPAASPPTTTAPAASTPMTPQQEPPISPAEQPAPPASAGLDIVVVDDSEDSADMFAEILRVGGHRVRVAYRGGDALRLLDQALPDVVFLDVGLPDMDGFEAASAIRARFGRDVRVVALTGFSGSEHRERAERAGFDAFMVKPFRKESLDEVLRDARR